MKILKYTQSEGFAATTVETSLKFELPESWHTTGELLKEVGWAKSDVVEHWLISETETGPTVAVYYSEDREQWLIDFDDAIQNKWIIVDGASDLMALQLALAPYFQQVLLETLLMRGSAAEQRDFMHVHHHEPNYPCSGCETQHERIMRQAREKRMRNAERAAMKK